MGWLTGWWSAVIERMVGWGGVVERMVEWIVEWGG